MHRPRLCELPDSAVDVDPNHAEFGVELDLDVGAVATEQLDLVDGPGGAGRQRVEGRLGRALIAGGRLGSGGDVAELSEVDQRIVTVVVARVVPPALAHGALGGDEQVDASAVGQAGVDVVPAALDLDRGDALGGRVLDRGLRGR